MKLAAGSDEEDGKERGEERRRKGRENRGLPAAAAEDDVKMA